MINKSIVTIVLLLPVLSFAGTLYESHAINPQTGELWETRMYLHKNHLRMLDRGSKQGGSSVSISSDAAAAASSPAKSAPPKWILEKEPDETIYNGPLPGMYSIDHKNKSAMDMTPKHVANKEKQESTPNKDTNNNQPQTVGGYMNQITQQLNQAMEGMPDNQKTIFKDMFSGTMGKNEKVEVLRRNKKDNKQGYDVELYESVSNGRKVREFWVTDVKNIKDGELLINTMKSMADLYREVMHSYAIPGRFIAMEFEDLDGKIPVVTKDFNQQGQLIKETTLAKVTDVKTADEDYDAKLKYQHYKWTSGLLYE